MSVESKYANENYKVINIIIISLNITSTNHSQETGHVLRVWSGELHVSRVDGALLLSKLN